MQTYQLWETGGKLVQHPQKKHLRTWKRFFLTRDVQRQEQRRRIPLARRLSKGFLSPIARLQELKA